MPCLRRCAKQGRLRSGLRGASFAWGFLKGLCIVKMPWCITCGRNFYLQWLAAGTNISIRVTTHHIHCGVEQLVARRAHNPKAAGSSPAPATNISGQDFFLAFVISSGKIGFRVVDQLLRNLSETIHLEMSNGLPIMSSRGRRYQSNKLARRYGPTEGRL